jgi:hypothetical protein
MTTSSIRGITAFVLLFLFLAASVNAQYPKDEVLNPYPKDIQKRTLLKKFACNSAELPEWTALHETTITGNAQSLTIKSSGTDPYVMLPKFPVSQPNQKPDASNQYSYEFLISMQSNATPAAEIFWATITEPNFCAENATRFSYWKGNETHTYSVIFNANSPLTRLRLDPGTSAGTTVIENVELYQIEYSTEKKEHTPWFNKNWAAEVKNWKTYSPQNSSIEIRFAENGTGAQIFQTRNNTKEHIGDIYPLAYTNTALPLGGVQSIPEVKQKTQKNGTTESKSESELIPFIPSEITPQKIALKSAQGEIVFNITDDEIHFSVSAKDNLFAPVFRPKGTMQQAILNGVEYLEKGEHSSSTADIETAEHFRFAPKELDLTWHFAALTTDKTGFGLIWNNAARAEGVSPPVSPAQAVFATPDFIFGDKDSHYLGLFGKDFAGAIKVIIPQTVNTAEQSNALNDLELLIVWGVNRYGLPALPPRPRDDEAQRQLSLAAFQNSALAVQGLGWRHALNPGAKEQHFGVNFGCDFVSAIWQLTGKLPEVPRLDHYGGHLRNPASFFLMKRGEQYRDMLISESKGLAKRIRPDGSFAYSGKYLKGHWTDTASGHCGNTLFYLMYDYQLLGNPEILDTVRKGLDFANKELTPRGAQVWELSLHTPDIMGSSRMCLVNTWFYEATGEEKYLNAARRWAVSGLPFVYLWKQQNNAERAEGLNEFVMPYATTPVLGATNWQAPNWIGLPVQWCGLDYSEALFVLAEHNDLNKGEETAEAGKIDWRKIAEGILITAEQMQYPSGESIGLLPDSFVLETQTRRPSDINPSVLVMQRRRVQNKLDSISVAVSKDNNNDKKYRVVSPYPAVIETADGKTFAVIDAVKGTEYQVLINGRTVKSIVSDGRDKIPLTE